MNLRRLWVFAALASLGCGYRFSPRDTALPEGLHTLCVPMFINQTAESGLETLFTQAMREQLVRSGTLGKDPCEARIEGVVLGVSSAPTILARNRDGTSGRLASYRASATVQLQIKREQRVVSQQVVSGSEDFLPGWDVVETEANRQAALRRLTYLLMREGYDRLGSEG